ncbi:LOW QUALITY PROTEIN: G protein-coupled receptor 65 [Spinachia spinachia]
MFSFLMHHFMEQKETPEEKCHRRTRTSAMDNGTLGTNDSECYFPESQSRRRLFLFFSLALILTAIPCNAFFFYVSWQHIRQQNGRGVYLFNLAVRDLTFTIGLSLWHHFLWKGVWVHGGYWLTESGLLKLSSGQSWRDLWDLIRPCPPLRSAAQMFVILKPRRLRP